LKTCAPNDMGSWSSIDSFELEFPARPHDLNENNSCILAYGHFKGLR
jgi:hypothetical protein